jgi:NAD(P)H-dependent FMN reductase
MKSHNSASRALLEEGLRLLEGVYPNVASLDLDGVNIPPFAGRNPRTLESPGVQRFLNAVDESAGLLISVPCYWSSVSGVFKNFVDVLCGAAYDLPDSQTVFSGKRVGLIVVGADEESAAQGHLDARRILGSVGASVIEDALVIANPRMLVPIRSTHAELTRLVGILAKSVLMGARVADE